MATTQGEIRVGPQNQVKDIYVRARQKDGNIFKILFFLPITVKKQLA